MQHGEIVIYKTEETPGFQIEVKVDDETVWLTQAQMAELFDATKQNVSLHINNIFREGELKARSVVKESLTAAKDGKSYNTRFYNLDVIISVGYRVKSLRGTQFRIWANNILKASIYTANLSPQMKHDLQRHNKQYPAIQIHAFNRAHDRFLIIDEETIYHIGASLKDLGKKWFAFSRINLDVREMLAKL